MTLLVNNDSISSKVAIIYGCLTLVLNTVCALKGF